MSENTDPQLNVSELYREETYTDRQVGTITKLVPVDSNGDLDGARSDCYLGSTQIMTPAGALPINFEIEASSLSEATEKFGVLAKEGIENTIKELQEMQRKQASSIVVPGQGSGIQVP